MKYQKRLKNNKQECILCPRGCKLSEGQIGFCGVRRNINGEIKLTVYGRNTGLSIDPIEKKPLYHFYPATCVLSFGTSGCNMGCRFCQNWHITKVGGLLGESEFEALNTVSASPEQIAQTALAYDCKSVAFTYNDPIIFTEYMIDTAKECKSSGVKTVAVTAGYLNKGARKNFFEYIDAVNIDLKSFSAEFYKKMCLADIKPVLDTLVYAKGRCITEVTTLLIEGKNDSDEEIRSLSKWVKENLGEETPLHFSAFYPQWKLKTVPPTSKSTILRAYKIATEIGLKHVYSGNISDDITSTTYCSNCKTVLIVRDGYKVITNRLLISGICPNCGKKLYGEF